MNACPNCNAPIKPGKSFCSKCGTQVPTSGPPPTGTRSGKSTVHLDPDALNLLLEQFANQPDGAVFSFREGKILVQQGEINVVMENLQMRDARVHVHHSRLGGVCLDMRELDLTPEGLQASIDLAAE